MQSIFSLTPEEILLLPEPHIFHAFIEYKLKNITATALFFKIRDAIYYKAIASNEVNDQKLYEKTFEVYNLLTH